MNSIASLADFENRGHDPEANRRVAAAAMYEVGGDEKRFSEGLKRAEVAALDREKPLPELLATDQLVDEGVRRRSIREGTSFNVALARTRIEQDELRRSAAARTLAPKAAPAPAKVTAFAPIAKPKPVTAAAAPAEPVAAPVVETDPRALAIRIVMGATSHPFTRQQQQAYEDAIGNKGQRGAVNPSRWFIGAIADACNTQRETKAKQFTPEAIANIKRAGETLLATIGHADEVNLKHAQMALHIMALADLDSEDFRDAERQYNTLRREIDCSNDREFVNMVQGALTDRYMKRTVSAETIKGIRTAAQQLAARVSVRRP